MPPRETRTFEVQNIFIGKLEEFPQPTSMVSTQGSHDNTCGFYSVVNAVTLVYYPGDTKNRAGLGKNQFKEELYQYLCKSFVKYRNRNDKAITNALTSGIKAGDLKDLLNIAKNFLSDKGFPSLKTDSLSCNRIDAIIKDMNQCMESGGACIVGLAGKMDHWTCVKSCTGKTVKLEDSDGMKVIKHDDMTTSTSKKDKYIVEEVFCLHS